MLNRLSRVVGLFWALCAGLVALFVFFALMGALSPVETAGLTGGVLVLGALFALHEYRLTRELHEHGHEDIMQELHRARERRGF